MLSCHRGTERRYVSLKDLSYNWGNFITAEVKWNEMRWVIWTLLDISRRVNEYISEIWMQDCFKTTGRINSRIVGVSALKIHMSENAHDAVQAFPEFITERRGEISIKVKYCSTIKMLFCFYQSVNW